MSKKRSRFYEFWWSELLTTRLQFGVSIALTILVFLLVIRNLNLSDQLAHPRVVLVPTNTVYVSKIGEVNPKLVKSFIYTHFTPYFNRDYRNYDRVVKQVSVLIHPDVVNSVLSALTRDRTFVMEKGVRYQFIPSSIEYRTLDDKTARITIGGLERVITRQGEKEYARRYIIDVKAGFRSEFNPVGVWVVGFRTE